MAVRLSREEAKAETRRRLLGAGRELFCRSGFQETRVEAICEAAGFTRGAFYAHFPSKDDLFLTLLHERSDRQQSQLQTAFQADLPLEARLDAAREWLSANIEAEQEFALAVSEFTAYAARDEELRSELAKLQERLRSQVSELVATYIEGMQLHISMPVREVATLVIALGEGLATQYYLDDETLPGQLFEKALVALVSGLVEAPHGPLAAD